MKEIKIKENVLYTMDIVDITTTGEGIGKIKGFIVFVDGGIPGDKVKIEIVLVKKNYSIGKLLRIIIPSSNRVKPPCKYFGDCGGCQIQNIEYSYQLSIKDKIVRDALVRIGGFNEEHLPIKPIVGMDEPYHYRNKGQYKVHSRDGLGFYQKKSHKVVPIDDCLIQREGTSQIIESINQFIKENHISIYDENNYKGLLRGVVERTSYLTGEIMIILVINAEEFKCQEELIEKLIKDIPKAASIYLNFNTKKTNVVLSAKNKLIYGKEKILDSIGEYKFEISPLSFFQINSVQTKVLYEKIVEFAELKGSEVVFDLYCGIGTISMYISKNAKKVYGIEIVPQAIEDAKENMHLNNVTNIEFIQGKSEEKMPELLQQGITPDLIIVDPPRKGCDEKLLKAITNQSPEKIIYVSCNPATLARDLKILCAQAYEIKEIQPVDMFGHSMHCEVICKMERL